MADEYLGLDTQLRQAWYNREEIDPVHPEFHHNASRLIDECIRSIQMVGLHKKGNFLRTVTNEVLVAAGVAIVTASFSLGTVTGQKWDDDKVDKLIAKLDSVSIQVKSVQRNQMETKNRAQKEAPKQPNKVPFAIK